MVWYAIIVIKTIRRNTFSTSLEDLPLALVNQTLKRRCSSSTILSRWPKLSTPNSDLSTSWMNFASCDMRSSPFRAMPSMSCSLRRHSSSHTRSSHAQLSPCPFNSKCAAPVSTGHKCRQGQPQRPSPGMKPPPDLWLFQCPWTFSPHRPNPGSHQPRKRPGCAHLSKAPTT